MSRQAAFAIALRGAFEFFGHNCVWLLILILNFNVEAAARRLKLLKLKFSRLTIFMAHRNVELLLSQE